MSLAPRAARSVAIVSAALLGIHGLSSTAGAQRARVGTAASAQPERGQKDWPLSGVHVSTSSGQRDWPLPGVHVSTGERRIPQQSRRSSRPAPRIIYVPVLVDVGHRAPSGVNDSNGRPLGEAYEMQSSAESSSFPAYTPDLSGTPYVVIESGAMVVDFGDGVRGTFDSCAVSAAKATPDSQPRTIFYRPPADGIVFRAGHSGRVRGAPPGGTKACYAADAYGRTELRY